MLKGVDQKGSSLDDQIKWIVFNNNSRVTLNRALLFFYTTRCVVNTYGYSCGSLVRWLCGTILNLYAFAYVNNRLYISVHCRSNKTDQI